MLTAKHISDIMNVSNDTYGGDNLRQKKHKEYVFIRAYQKKFGYTDKEMGDKLSCSARTYNDKVLGWNDFTPLEGKELARIFDVSQSVLFLT